MNGHFGEVWEAGRWLTNFNEVEAEVEIKKEEIKRSGTRWVGHKITSLTGKGKLKGMKVTSEWLKKIGQVRDDRATPYYTELIYKLDDPEAFGCERTRLKNVMFDKIPLQKWKAGDIVEEELEFTFVDYELLDTIEE